MKNEKAFRVSVRTAITPLLFEYPDASIADVVLALTKEITLKPKAKKRQRKTFPFGKGGSLESHIIAVLKEVGAVDDSKQGVGAKPVREYMKTTYGVVASPEQVRYAMNKLIERGVADYTGRGSGTKYHLLSANLP